MTASMIVALGPQNAFLIKLGLSKSRIAFNVAAIYILIDVILISFGALGVGAFIADQPMLRISFSFLASAFFLYFGLSSIRSALSLRTSRPDQISVSSGDGYFKAILISVLNPGVLFDTIVLIGGLAAQFQDFTDRLWFLAGAMSASMMWFTLLAVASFYAGRFVNGKTVWVVLELVIGCLMIVLAAVLLLENELVLSFVRKYYDIPA